MIGKTRLNLTRDLDLSRPEIDDIKVRLHRMEVQELTAAGLALIIFNDAEGNPADVASASADGASSYAARRNHVHTIAAGTVTNAMRANMAQATVSGRASGAGTGAPTDLSAAQLVAIITTADGAGSGLDADLLDGLTSAFYSQVGHTHETADISDLFNDVEGDPADVATAASDGLSLYVSHRDHVHKLSSSVSALFANLAGQSGGQHLKGGTGSGENLTLASTNHATKGKILFGTSAYDEVNNRLGLGTASPGLPLDTVGIARLQAGVIFHPTTTTIEDGYSVAFVNDGSLFPLRIILPNDAGNPRHLQVGRYVTGTWTPVATINAQSGNMGLGTTTLTARLEVSKTTGSNNVATFTGSAATTVIDQFGYFITSGTNATAGLSGTGVVSLMVKNTSNKDWRIESHRTAAAGSLEFTNATDAIGSPRIVILPAGDVGISNTTPSGLTVSVAVSESAIGSDNVRMGVLSGTPRIILEDASSTQWEIDNNGGSLRFYNPGAVKAILTTDPRLGLGLTSPQGMLHGHDGTGGFLFVTKTGVAGTAVNVIPDGTGDTTARLFAMYSVKSSGGLVGTGTVTSGVSVSNDLFNDGTNIFRIIGNANGSIDVQRTGGSQTWTVALCAIWL